MFSSDKENPERFWVGLVDWNEQLQVLQLGVEDYVLHSILNSPINSHFPACVLSHFGGGRGEFVRLGIQNVDLVAAREVGIGTLDSLALGGTVVVVAH